MGNRQPREGEGPTTERAGRSALLPRGAWDRERRRAQRFFNRTSPLYPVVERHLWPQYRQALGAIDLPRNLSVLDLATGTGLLAGAFSDRGHPVTGLDFTDRLLRRARRRFPRVELQSFDLVQLDRIEASAYDAVSMGYLLHGLSPEFRRFVLGESARIARAYVLVFDYGCGGGWLVRLIEWVEGPGYPELIAGDREEELRRAGLQLRRTERVSELGSYWLCAPGQKETRRVGGSKELTHGEKPIPEP